MHQQLTNKPQNKTIMTQRFFTTESFKNAVLDYQRQGRAVVEVARVLEDASRYHFYGRYVNKRIEAIESLNIADYSEVVPTFEIREYNGGEYLGAMLRGYSLHLFSTGEYIYIGFDKNDKVYLASWAGLDINTNDLKYFHTELTEPNHIGSATIRKVEQWREYINALTAEKLTYINANICRVSAQMQRAAEKEGASVERNSAGEITRVVVPVGGAKIYFTRGEKSVNYTYGIDYETCGAFVEGIIEG